mmetsp:Transcript_50383/g.90069  ORF Transcript_50383/g.90069 Transcript_50383/m.90069 type:complete len:239 (+) Transcript_50383:1260-1976(+)
MVQLQQQVDGGQHLLLDAVLHDVQGQDVLGGPQEGDVGRAPLPDPVPQEVQVRDPPLGQQHIRQARPAVGADVIALQIQSGEAAAVGQDRAEEGDGGVREGGAGAGGPSPAVQLRDAVGVDLGDRSLQEEGLVIESDRIAQGHVHRFRDPFVVVHREVLDGVVVGQRALQGPAAVVGDVVGAEVDGAEGVVLGQHGRQQLDASVADLAVVQVQSGDVDVGVQQLHQEPEAVVRHAGVV